MVDTAMKTRKEKLEHSMNLEVQMRPEFVEALELCKSFSSKYAMHFNFNSSQRTICCLAKGNIKDKANYRRTTSSPKRGTEAG